MSIGLPVHLFAGEPAPAEVRQHDDRSFPFQVWRHYWATFSQRSRVAARLGYSVEQFDTLAAQRGWLLQSPPALNPPGDLLHRAARFGDGVKAPLSVADFIADAKGTAPAAETRVEVLADDEGLRLEFRCAEPAAGALLTRATQMDDQFRRWVLDGDAHQLYQICRQIKPQALLERVAAVPPRKWSVYEDDCVFVRLTPLAPGEDLSREFRVRDQPQRRV